MQSTFDPDIVIDKIDIQMNGTSIQVLVSYRKDQKVIAINPVSDTRIIVQAPYDLSKEELRWHIRSYLTAQDRNETTVTKKNTGSLTGGTIHIRGLDIPYTVIQNPRRKTLYLSVYPDGRVEVENPGTASEADIIRFLTDEQEWLYREYYCTRPECPPATEEHTVRIHEKIIPYHISRSTRNKRITLKIHGNGTVEVSAPYDTPTNKITAFVESRKSWIAPKIGVHPPEPSSDTLSHKTTPIAQDGDAGQITYEGHIIPYTIKRNPRAKRTTIKVNREREVCVVSPPHIPVNQITGFMIQNAEWVYSHTITSARPLPPKRTYEDGEVFPFLGESITIRIRRGTELSCEGHQQELMITVPSDFTDYNVKMAVKQAVAAYFAEQLYQFSIPYFTQYAALLKVPIPQIKTRDQKTKWGACTSKSIILNLRLCMAPARIIEYVVLHELAHKIHPDHSPRFWNTVERMMPDYKERREYLKKHGHEWTL